VLSVSFGCAAEPPGKQSVLDLESAWPRGHQMLALSVGGPSKGSLGWWLCCLCSQRLQPRAIPGCKAHGGCGWWLHCYRGGCCCYQHNRGVAVVKHGTHSRHRSSTSLCRASCWPIQWQLPREPISKLGPKGARRERSETFAEKNAGPITPTDADPPLGPSDMNWVPFARTVPTGPHPHWMGPGSPIAIS
jgi:hypothetical protein